MGEKPLNVFRSHMCTIVCILSGSVTSSDSGHSTQLDSHSGSSVEVQHGGYSPLQTRRHSALQPGKLLLYNVMHDVKIVLLCCGMFFFFFKLPVLFFAKNTEPVSSLSNALKEKNFSKALEFLF